MVGNINASDNISSGDKRDKSLLFFLMFLPCCFVFLKILDNDFWFIINSGRFVMNHGIPYLEPFTIHNGMSFVMQQWLSAVIFWLIYSSGGELGIKLLVMLCHILLVFLVFRLCMKVSRDNFVVSFTIALFAGVFASVYMTSRPIIFTLLIILVEFYSLESFIREGNRRFLLVLPLLSLLEINLHAALWPILFVLVLPYVIDSFDFKLGPIIAEGYDKKYLFAVIALMFLAGFGNPYGWDAITYLVKSFGHSEMHELIIELKPPNINTLTGMMIYAAIFVVFFTYCVYRQGKTTLRYILLTAGTTFLVLSSFRNISFFVVSSFFPLAHYLQDLTFPTRPEQPSKRVLLLRKVLIGLIVLMLFFIFWQEYNPNGTSEAYQDLNHAVDYILDNEDPESIVLYTGFNDGGLAEFRGLSAYIDPRAEVFVKKVNRKDDIMLEYRYLQEGSVYYKSVLDKYEFTHLLVGKADILSTYLPFDDDYQMVYANSSYEVYISIASMRNN